MKHLPKDKLKWVAAAFALVATATAEYEIARAIGMHPWVAAAVPGALDAYVVRALIQRREVLTAVLAMVAVNAASHLVTAGLLPIEWWLITSVSAIAPLVLWRVHALGTPGEWRERKLWGLSTDEHAAVLASTVDLSAPDGEHTVSTLDGPAYLIEHTASTEPCPECEHGTEHGVLTSTEPEHTEHDRAPDNPEPPGTREHPEVCYCGAEVWGDLGAHQRAPWHPAEHTASTDQARVRAQTDAWGDDWMDVHDAVHTASTPPVPVHAPYADHVDVASTQPMPARHLEIVRGLQVSGTDEACPRVEHTASTFTAEEWNQAHVRNGVLEPDDTEHMERARELFHTIGGVPPFRALKEGTPGMGTPRAQRIRAALKIENEGTD